MRVCFIAGTLGRGGAETQLVYMLRALLNEGIEAKVLCLTKDEPVEREIRDLGVAVEWIGRSQNRLIRLRVLVNTLRREPVQILQSSHFYTNIYTAFAGRALRIPSIGAIRGDLKKAMASNGCFGRTQLKSPKHIITNSRSAMTDAIALGIDSNRIDFVGNAVAVGNRTKAINSFIERPLNILFAGRLVSVKRPEVFLRLAAELLVQLASPHLNFKIVGDGPLRPQLEKLAIDLGLMNKGVTFLGERSDMDQIYRAADILVLTSEHEGTPNVVLEAMAHGIPVVATRVGGVPEILTDGRGFVVGPDDFDGLFKCTARLIRNGELRRRMGENGREFVLENHSFQQMQSKLANIYSKILDRSDKI